MEFGLAVVEAEIDPEGEPVVFDFAPEDFDEVEFGTVGWQPMQGVPCRNQSVTRA